MNNYPLLALVVLAAFGGGILLGQCPPQVQPTAEECWSKGMGWRADKVQGKMVAHCYDLPEVEATTTPYVPKAHRCGDNWCLNDEYVRTGAVLTSRDFVENATTTSEAPQ